MTVNPLEKELEIRGKMTYKPGSNTN